MEKRVVGRSRRGAPRLHIIIQSVPTVAAFQLDDRLCDTIWNASKIHFFVRACHGVAVASWYIHATVVALSSLASGDREIEHSTVSPVGIRALLLLLLLPLID